MKVAIDPYMVRDRGIDGIFRYAKEHGFDWVEFSAREDFLPIHLTPRVSDKKLDEIRAAMDAHEVGIANMWAVYRWAEPGDPDAHEAAMRSFERFVAAAAALELPMITSEFGGQPGDVERSDYAFWRSMEKVVPILEQHEMTMALDPHPGDFVEDGYKGVDMIRAIGSPRVQFLYATPHTFFLTDDMPDLIRYASDCLRLVRLADTFDHRQHLRYIVNPFGAPVTVHQHLNIGEGEVDWDAFFGTLKEIGFDGVMSSSVFAWPDRADESAEHMRKAISDYLARHGIGGEEKPSFSN